MNVVDVELLVVPDCPNESVALTVLRLAFDRVGLAAQSVRTTVIASQEQAQERGFTGFANHPHQRRRPARRCRAEPGVRLPRLCHPDRIIGRAAVGRRHLRPDRR
jgi:hypothetical protein